MPKWKLTRHLTRWHVYWPRKNEKLARFWHVGTWARRWTLACMACMARNLANFHTLYESVNVTMNTTINFDDIMTLCYLVIKEKFEKMWVIVPYFVWVAVSVALFWVSVSYFGWMRVDGALFWVGGMGGDAWGIVLFGWEWVGHYFGWVGVVWKCFVWVEVGGSDEWGWVHHFLSKI